MKNMISIIVPIFNASEYLSECLDSIVNQTYKNVEILLIDDGSTDDSYKICKRYEENDNRIRIITKENTGVSDSRNIGIKQSKGDFLMFVDSDDYLELNMIQEMHDAYIENKADVVRCKAIIHEKSGGFQTEDFYGLKLLNKEDISKNIYRFITRRGNIACFSPVLLIKKDKIVMYDTSLSFLEDGDFYLRLLFNIDSIYFLNRNLYHYRYNDKSLTKNISNSITNVYRLLASSKAIKRDIDNHSILSDEIKREINSNIFQLIITQLYRMCAKNTISKSRNNIRELYKDEDFIEVIMNIDYSSLTKIKGIILFITKKRLINFLVIILKIIGIIKLV